MNNSEGQWDKKYLELAKHVSTWSKDPSTQVGAVLVNWGAHKEFIGYNGFPRGVKDLYHRYDLKATKYQYIVHAEVNAIIKAGHLAQGATLYVYPTFAMPNICNECSKVAIQAGIGEVVGYLAPPPDERTARWKESIDISASMLTEAGIQWRSITP